MKTNKMWTIHTLKCAVILMKFKKEKEKEKEKEKNTHKWKDAIN